MSSDPRAVENILRLWEQALDDIGAFNIPAWVLIRCRDRFVELLELNNIVMTITEPPGNPIIEEILRLDDTDSS